MQKVSLGLDVWMTVVAILLSVPLMLVGLRVLGETNWGPISALSNMMQGIFGVLAPGHIVANMVASGTTGTIATSSEAIMQDYKAGDMIGTTPRNLTIMQLIAVPVGAAAVSWMYPAAARHVRHRRRARGADLADLEQVGRLRGDSVEGVSALPPGAITALVIAVIIGIIFTVLEDRKVKWVPSPTGLGIGMLVPASVIFVMFLGGVVERVWARIDRASNDTYMVPLASGLIAGEAIVAVIVPLLVVRPRGVRPSAVVLWDRGVGRALVFGAGGPTGSRARRTPPQV